MQVITKELRSEGYKKIIGLPGFQLNSDVVSLDVENSLSSENWTVFEASPSARVNSYHISVI